MSDTTAAGLTEAEREALWGVDADIETFAVVERILGARLAAVQAERDAARAEVQTLRERVEALADDWETDDSECASAWSLAADALRAALEDR